MILMLPGVNEIRRPNGRALYRCVVAEGGHGIWTTQDEHAIGVLEHWIDGKVVGAYENGAPIGRADDRAGAVVLDMPGNPFHGLNYWKAQAINDVFCGRRVIVAGGKHDDTPREYVFIEMALPGEWASGFVDAYDLTLQNGTRGGSTRHISPALVTMFLTVEAPELTPCSRCNEWKPMSELRTPWWDPSWPAEEWPRYLECRHCPEDDPYPF
jgi:hypothetical protein